MNASIRVASLLALLVGSAEWAGGQTLSGPAGVYQLNVPSPVQIQSTPTSILFTWSANPPAPSPIAPTLRSIFVLPATSVISVGATQQFTATGTYSDGTTQSLTNQVMWVSSSPINASITVGGIVVGLSSGRATITASVNGVSGTSDLTVSPLIPPFVPPNPPAPPGPSPTPMRGINVPFLPPNPPLPPPPSPTPIFFSAQPPLMIPTVYQYSTRVTCW